MPPSLEQFRLRLRSYAESDLKQTLENCRGKDEYEHAVKEELNARCPGWDRPRTRRGGSRETIARFRGKEQEFDTARAAYIWLVERFAEINPTLFTDIRWETTGYVGVGRRRGPDGAARNYFAKSPKGLFRRTPTLADSPSNFHCLANGWYVNLNLNTRENFEILCRFSSVSGLTHHQDWDWEVLDPTDELRDSKRRMELAAEIQKELDDYSRGADAYPFTGTSHPVKRRSNSFSFLMTVFLGCREAKRRRTRNRLHIYRRPCCTHCVRAQIRTAR